MRARLALPFILILLAGCAATPRPSQPASVAVPDGSTAQLTVLETTDLHSNVLSYDYYQLRADPTVGFERVATLIGKARKTFPNTVLFDAGDTIQGTVLADYQALVKPVDCATELAVYKAMDSIGYDAGTAGNHEFNYGLQFLSQVTGTPMDVAGVPPDQHCAGPHYPIVLSNVFSDQTGQPIFKPYTIITRTLTATAPDGRSIKAPIRIGLIGFTPPGIMDWDQRNLAGKVHVMGVVEAARHWMPKLEAEHPDLIIGIVHGGISTAPDSAKLDNAALYLAQVPGFDALMLGHSHQRFPGPDYAHIAGVDDTRGTVHGVPAVMADFFGKDLGLIHLKLDYTNGHWHSDAAAAQSDLWPICPSRGHCVAPDPAIAPLIAAAQQGAVAYVTMPIGHTDFRLSSYFADVGDMSALSVVNAAQSDYVKHWIAADHPELADIPVLSAAAPFRTGFAGPDEYTDVAVGPLTIRSASDLYFYPNTLAAVKVDGAGLKAWLEHSAERFRRINPNATEPQPLLNPHFNGYNFDQIQGGIHYAIDVTRPVGQRITGLTWHNQPVRADQHFIVVTNNYRASGGGHFPGLDGKNVVLLAPDGNREVLINWLRAHPNLQRDELPARSWDFVPVTTRAPVTFESASGKLDVAREANIHGLRVLADHGDGTSTYAIDLAGKN